MENSIQINEKNEKQKSFTGHLYDWVEALIFSFIVIILLFTFAFRFVGVKGESMTDTLKDKDRLIISNLFYKPQKGDIVVITRNYKNLDYSDKETVKEPLIKRIIATSGDEVDIKNGSVYVNKKRIEENYVTSETTTDYRSIENNVFFPLTVPQGQVFYLGDNRSGSADSRIYGTADERSIIGKVIFRIYPLSEFKLF